MLPPPRLRKLSAHLGDRMGTMVKKKALLKKKAAPPPPPAKKKLKKKAPPAPPPPPLKKKKLAVPPPPPPPKKKAVPPPPPAKKKAPAKKAKKPTKVVDMKEEETAAIIERLPTTLEILKGKTLLAQPTTELCIAVAHLVKNGNNTEVACRAMGIPRSTIRSWIERGLAELDDPSSVYGKFVLAVDSADAQDEANDLMGITLGFKHWAALAWKRERKTAQRWSQKAAPQSELVTLAMGETPTYSVDEAALIMAILETHKPTADPVLEGETVEVQAP